LDPELLRALLTVLFGALAGGITNSVAVWMLFNPHKPPRLFGRELRVLQGAIPKNQPRLAAAMGRTVGGKLLTPEDLSRSLQEPAFRKAFDERLTAFIESVFNEERGSLQDLLPPDVLQELRGLLQQAAAHGLVRLDAWLASDDFHAATVRWVDALAREVADRPISDVLTPEREDALAASAERWIADAVEAPGFEAAIADYLDRGTTRLLKPGRTFQDLLPQGLVSAVERAISGYLPIALERLGGLMEEPAARSRVEKIVHELLDRFMRDLKFHQRLVAALIITPETIDKVILAIEEEGASKIAEMLQDDDVRDAMARGVNDAIVDFLRKPVTDVLGTADDESVRDVRATVEGWVLQLARDPQTRAFLVEKLRATIATAERRTWNDVLRHVPTERVADVVARAARSDRAKEIYADAVDRLIEAVLSKKIGRLADRLGPDVPARVEGALAEPLWDWVQRQVPSIAQRIDIAAKVEKKILEFPTQQVEDLIKGVIERELQLIVRLGYVLGGMIGLGSAVLGSILS
jgi:uncharacterized membrane protein YheB (UPF0754 family)